VPEVVELTESGEIPVLVLHSTAELFLDEWVRDALPEFGAALEVFIQLARVLERAQLRRMVLRDIRPSLITIDREPLRPWFQDLELTRALGGVSADDAQLCLVDRTTELHYISPEATGRMGRGVDSRSDLYSLGATLYFALTGRAPFEGDPLALVHSHIARVPPPCNEVRSEVPPTLSRIVGKLLQKAPEDRYQTAYALRRDLEECHDQLRRTGSIQNDLPLAAHDAPYRPSFSRRIYGREREIDRLKRAYARCLEGTPILIRIAGAPGIGKSVLVEELRESLVEGNGHLASGKFDLYRRELPYAAITQALNSLAQQLLTESDTRLGEWRDALLAGLGIIAGAIVALAPDLGLVLGEVPPLPLLGVRETRARLSLVFQRLIRVLARESHPLVLFLDDLQWADSASRDLLRDVLSQDRTSALLLVAAYRDTEIEPGDPLLALFDDLAADGVAVESVRLDGLGEDDCALMLANALGRSPETTLPLARCVGRKTGNSPLLIQQFIGHMYDLDLIRFESAEGWSWDIDAISAAEIPEGAIALLTAKIARLPEAAARVLQLASCAGDEFDRAALTELGGAESEELDPALFTLSDEGLISPSRSGFRFVHDRIREAAQSLLSESERQQMHARAARLLIERTAPEELVSRAFDIADHFNLAREALDASERARALEINLLAGKRALVSGAAVTAGRYLREARALHSDELWSEQPGLCLDLFMQSVESALQTRDAEDALRMLDVVESKPLDRMAAASAAAKRISAAALCRPADEVLAMVLEALARFGIQWPARPGRLRTRWLIWRTDRILRGPLDPASDTWKGDGDATWIAPGMIMAAGGPVVSVASPTLLCFIVSYWLTQFRQHGTLTPVMALATYGSVRLGFGGSIAGSLRLAEASEAWSKLRLDPRLEPRARYLRSALIHSWTRSRRGVIEPLRLAAEELFEVGDTEYGFFALAWRSNFLCSVGEPLDGVLREQEALADRMRSEFAVPERLKARALHLLTAGPPRERSLDEEIEAIDARMRACDSARMGAWAIWGMVLTVLERFAEVLRIPDEPEQSTSYATDLFLFRGIAAAARAATLRGAARRGQRRILRQSLRRAVLLASFNSESEYALLGLRAEDARLRGRTKVAQVLYAQAADRAAKIGIGTLLRCSTSVAPACSTSCAATPKPPPIAGRRRPSTKHGMPERSWNSSSMTHGRSCGTRRTTLAIRARIGLTGPSKAGFAKPCGRHGLPAWVLSRRRVSRSEG